MPENLLIPSVDLRIAALEEYNRQQKLKAGFAGEHSDAPPCITISREFGCEAYPVAEHLSELLRQKTGNEWLVMDKALLEEVSRRHNISEDILRGLGEKNKIFDEVMATFSPSWKTDRDHFKLLASYIISLASHGNVIIVGRGSAIITAHLPNCHHFRLYGSMEFKSASIATRLKISLAEASRLIERKQAQRDSFTSNFLGRSANDLGYYDLLFNNDKSSTKKIACTIFRHVLFSSGGTGCD